MIAVEHRALQRWAVHLRSVRLQRALQPRCANCQAVPASAPASVAVHDGAHRQPDPPPLAVERAPDSLTLASMRNPRSSSRWLSRCSVAVMRRSARSVGTRSSLCRAASAETARRAPNDCASVSTRSAIAMLRLGNQFRGRRGRGRSQVRHKICNRKIRFVPDRRDHRQVRRDNCPRHPLAIESAQVLKRSAAARYDDHVHQPAGIQLSSAASTSPPPDHPGPRQDTRCTFNPACRRPAMLRKSRITAPVGDVIIPTERGNAGSGRLRADIKSPSAFSRSLSCSKANCSEPAPTGSIVSPTSCSCPRCA